jgi:hypothetical protein
MGSFFKQQIADRVELLAKVHMDSLNFVSDFNGVQDSAREVSGYHSGKDIDDVLLDCDAVWTCR